MSRSYYNDFDPFVCEWLENLIAAGHLPAGDVDDRSITEVRPDDLAGYDQAHFFAGIGGWPLALRRAGWPDDLPVWTGSCPCQPFSTAGARRAFDDDRHLFPALRALIAEHRPPVVFGEQVASSLGREWLAGVQTALEALGYGCASADLCAAGVAAPHIRQRLWWGAVHDRGIAEQYSRLADSRRQRDESRGHHLGGTPGTSQGDGGQRQRVRHDAGDGIDAERLADSDDVDRERHSAERGEGSGAHGREVPEAGRRSADDDAQWTVYADWSGLEGHGRLEQRPGQLAPWATDAAVYCRDGAWRRIEPGALPLAHGVPARVGRLRSYGNAIVPQVAAVFVESFMAAAAQQ